MKNLIINLRSRLSTIAVIAIAIAVGSLSGAVVLASIPDNSGKINACYKNSTKVLSVTDQAGNCGSNETPLSWSQNGTSGGSLVAYAHIIFDSNTNLYSLDTARSQNIIFAQNPPGYSDICIKVASTIQSIQVTPGGSSNVSPAAFKDQAGWTKPNNGSFCEQEMPGSNAVVGGNQTDLFVTFF